MSTHLPRVLASLLLALAACGGHIDSSLDGNCPAPTPGLCAPSACNRGVVRTGQASCVSGAWTCEETTCDGTPIDACDGTLLTSCDSTGKIEPFCCPKGAMCNVPVSYCDLGGGACRPFACVDGGAPPPVEDAGTGVVDASDAGDAPTCAAGSIYASSYDRSCASDSDCVSVYEGSLCGNCFCPGSGAINQSALDAYRSDFAARDAGVNACSCPFFGKPHCTAGLCTRP